MHGPDGTDYPNQSIFREVVPAERIVIEHLGGFHHFMLTITFEARAGGTLVRWRQVFDTPEHSRALLQGRASLLDRGRRVVVDRLVDIEQAATTPDARGGVVALVSVSDELGRQLAAWLNDLEKRGTLKGCRVTAAHYP